MWCPHRLLERFYYVIFYIRFVGFSCRPLLFYRSCFFSPATQFMVPGLNAVSLGGQLETIPNRQLTQSSKSSLTQIWFKFATFFAQIVHEISLQDIFLCLLRVSSCFFHMVHILPPQFIEPSGGWFFRNSCDAVAEAHREIVGNCGCIEFDQSKLLSSDHFFQLSYSIC